MYAPALNNFPKLLRQVCVFSVFCGIMINRELDCGREKKRRTTNFPNFSSTHDYDSFVVLVLGQGKNYKCFKNFARQFKDTFQRVTLSRDTIEP